MCNFQYTIIQKCFQTQSTLTEAISSTIGIPYGESNEYSENTTNVSASKDTVSIWSEYKESMKRIKRTDVITFAKNWLKYSFNDFGVGIVIFIH